MTRKILLLVLLAGFAAVATEALSQNPGGGAPAGPGASGPTSNKVTPPVTTTPGKSDVATPSAPASKDVTPEKSPPVTKDTSKETASKENPSSKGTPTGKDAKEGSKDVPSSKTTAQGKDASSSKTVPTSAVTPAPSAAKSLVVDRA